MARSLGEIRDVAVDRRLARAAERAAPAARTVVDSADQLPEIGGRGVLQELTQPRLAMRAGWPTLALAVTAAITLAGLAISFTYPLNGDVQYVLGGLSVSQHPAWDVFVHRPLLYRLLLAPMAGLPEPMIRVLGIGFAGVVGWVLARSTGRPAVGAATAIGLALSPSWFFLQPEWFAAAFGALAVALRRIPAAAGAGLVAAAFMKLATLPISLLGLLLIFALDRDARRLAMVIAWSLTWGVAWLALSLVVEFQWLVDMSTLTSTSLLQGGDLHMFEYLPILLAAAPVTVAGLLAIPSRRLALFLVLVAAFVLAAGPLFVQGRGTLYHLAAVPVLAAAVIGWRAPPLLPVVALLCAVTMLPGWDWGTGRTNASWEARVEWERASMVPLSQAIGRETPVTYLSYGLAGYFMGNPTECRYPSPLWLVTGVHTVTAADNRRCLDDAGWIVVQPDWFGEVTCDERITFGPVYACPPGSWTPADLPARARGE